MFHQGAEKDHVTIRPFFDFLRLGEEFVAMRNGEDGEEGREGQMGKKEMGRGKGGRGGREGMG